MCNQYNSFRDKHRTVVDNSAHLLHGLAENYAGVSLLGSMPLHCGNKNISIQRHLYGLQARNDIANTQSVCLEKPYLRGNPNIESMNVFRPLHRDKPYSHLQIAPGDQP
jgi:hypothetical protein